MTKVTTKKKRKAIVLAPGEGRTYSMGRIQSVFKADGAETGNSYSVSEWWMDLPQGSVVVIPGGTLHTFENRNKKRRAGILSFNNRAGFEKQMPDIVDWFADNPAGDALRSGDD